jgi:hypothetical protein
MKFLLKIENYMMTMMQIIFIFMINYSNAYILYGDEILNMSKQLKVHTYCNIFQNFILHAWFFVTVIFLAHTVFIDHCEQCLFKF